MLDWQHMAENAIALAVAGGMIVVATRKLRSRIDETREEVVHAVRSERINGWLETLIAAMPYPAWVKRVEKSDTSEPVRFRMQFINRAYERQFGKRLDQYEGRTDYEVWPEPIAEQYYRHDAEVLASRSHVRFRERVRMPDGTDREFEFEKGYLRKGDVEGIIGFMRPVVTQDDE